MIRFIKIYIGAQILNALSDSERGRTENSVSDRHLSSIWECMMGFNMEPIWNLAFSRQDLRS